MFFEFYPAEYSFFHIFGVLGMSFASLPQVVPEVVAISSMYVKLPPLVL